MTGYIYFKTTSSSGVILYGVYDTELMSVRLLEYNDIIVCAANIVNLRLENTVVKAVDMQGIPRLSEEETAKDSVFYAIPDNTGLLTLVSNRGEIYRMSPNVMSHFKGRVLNVSKTSKGHEVNAQKAHTAPLSRPLDHVIHNK